MYLLGSFVTQQFTDKAVLADIDFFPFPEIAVEGTDAIEAPIDGLMLSKKGGKNQAAKDLLAYIGTPRARTPTPRSTLEHRDRQGRRHLQVHALNKKCAEAIADAKYISQFFDRDALPAMANNVMIPALQGFIKNGNDRHGQPGDPGQDPVRRAVARPMTTQVRFARGPSPGAKQPAPAPPRAASPAVRPRQGACSASWWASRP